MRWGLVPRWAKDPSIGTKTDQRARRDDRGQAVVPDGVSPPSLPAARRRLLRVDDRWPVRAPASHRASSRSTSAWRTASLFGFAGLYERWRSEDGEVLDTCTIVTTEANALLRPVHDRMPVIVAPEHYARWLDPANAEVVDLIVPFPAAAMAYYPVSTRVNNVRHDDATLIERDSSAPAANDAEHGPPPHRPEQEELF